MGVLEGDREYNMVLVQALMIESILNQKDNLSTFPEKQLFSKQQSTALAQCHIRGWQENVWRLAKVSILN